MILKLAKNYLTKKPDAVKRLVFALFSYCIRERIPNNLWCILHHNVIANARSRSANLPCDSRIAVILVVKLVHQDQFFWCNSFCHGLLSGLGGTRRGLQLRIGMIHRFAPAFVDVSAERLDLRLRAAEILAFSHLIFVCKTRRLYPRF